jgi:predicted RNA-binding Zn ribbon-like protein
VVALDLSASTCAEMCRAGQPRARTGYHRTVSASDPSAVPAGGSDPAPGPLHLVQSFASTRSADPDMDLLHTREEAAAWLHAAALLPAEAGLTNSEHAALLRLRESIRDVLAAHTDGRQDAAAAARLTRALADGRLVLTVDPASTVQLSSAARASYPNLVAAVAIAIAGSASSGTWPRLKSCPAPHCGQAFYDDSASSAASRCSTHAPGRVTTGRSGK